MSKEKKEKGEPGRPARYTQELADRFCGELAKGRSMHSICKEDWTPARSTIFKWLREVDGFTDQYEKAKEESADYLVEEMLDIADNGNNDWMEKLGKDGQDIGYQLNGEHVQRSRLRLDTRKWVASKLKAKKYGDKITTEHTGKVALTDLTDEQLDQKLKALLNAGTTDG